MKLARVVVAVLLGIAVVGASILSLVFSPAAGSKDEVVPFVVEEGSSLRRVASDLEDAGLIRSGWAFGL